MSYQQQAEQEMWDAIASTDRSPVPSQHAQSDEPLATEKQVSYLEALRDGKDTSKLSPQQRAWLADADFTKIPRKRASDVIEQLKKLDWIPRNNIPGDSGKQLQELQDAVPDGRYAVEKDDGTLMFYSVKKGKYVTFVDVWASDARWPVKNVAERIRILAAIAKDPRGAMNRFGQEIGRCGRCGRTLTRQDSRDRGLGPDCAQIMEW